MKLNLKITIFSVVFVLGIISCTVEKEIDKRSGSKYIMDMVYNNLGLPPRISEFNNPEYIKEMGFNGMIPHWYVQCAITYDSLEKGIIPKGSDERKWIQENAVELNKKIYIR